MRQIYNLEQLYSDMGMADDVSRESMTLVSIHPRIAPHGDFTG